MSEQNQPPPKPFRTVEYIIRATFWAFAIPGAIAHALVVLLMVLSDGMYVLGGLFFGVCLFAICVFIVVVGVRFQKRLSANIRAGQMPGSFALWIFPFWLPLFWGLAATAIGFCAAIVLSDFYVGVRGIFLGFPQYFIFHAIVANGGSIVFLVVAFSVVTFLFAVVATAYVFCLAPPVPKVRGIVIHSFITLLLCGLVGWSYSYFQAEVLYPFSGFRSINDRNLYGSGSFSESGSDTDLTEYIPFVENNKLVKIESPTLVINADHPRIHGAFALHPVYAAAVEATYRNVGKMIFDPTNGNAGVKSGTSPEAFESLLTHQSDMIFMLQPSEKQLQEAKNRGIRLIITPIGHEAFVFFVSKVNPVDDLSLDQIRDIYSKKIIRWNEVGGKNERILPFQRPEGSGSQTAMLRVMGDVPIAPPLPGEFRKGMGGIVESVADYRNYGNSLGFSFRYYVEGLYKHEGVKLLKTDGVAPTIENIQNESYPLIGELVIISRPDNRNPHVKKMTEWFLSPQGQELIQNVGYVPLK